MSAIADNYGNPAGVRQRRDPKAPPEPMIKDAYGRLVPDRTSNKPFTVRCCRQSARIVRAVADSHVASLAPSSPRTTPHGKSKTTRVVLNSHACARSVKSALQRARTPAQRSTILMSRATSHSSTCSSSSCFFSLEPHWLASSSSAARHGAIRANG